MTNLFTKGNLNKVVLIPIGMIDPNPAQPRRAFGREELISLAKSIKENGLLQPVSLRKKADGRYELISGERRLLACKMLSREQIEAIVYEMSDSRSAILCLVENMQRQDLNFFEEAGAIKRLLAEWNITQEMASEKLGIAQSTLSNKLRILRLSDEAKAYILDNRLTERHARAVLPVEGDDQMRLLRLAVKNGLNVSRLEQLVADWQKSGKPASPKKPQVVMIKDMRLFINSINRAIQMMNTSGINAQSTMDESRDYIEYVIKIPKQEAYRKK